MENFLSEEEREKLRFQHRRERDRRIAERIKAVLLKDLGWTNRQIAIALMLDEETIAQHVNDYRKSKKLKPENGGSVAKFSKAQTTELIAHLEQFTYTNVQDICVMVLEEHGVKYTRTGMTDWLHAHKFSYKQPKGTPAKADREAQLAFIDEYNRLLKTTPEEEPIEFLDGVHPTMATKVTCGWIRTGKEKEIATTASRTRINLLGSINLENMSVSIGEYETIDSKAMELHFHKLKEKYPKAPKIHIILDNGPYNTSQETKDRAAKNSIVLHFLPTYSPNLKAIERLWKVMNEHVRNNQFFKSVKEFRLAIHDFFAKTWPSIAQNMISRIDDNFHIVGSTSSI